MYTDSDDGLVTRSPTSDTTYYFEMDISLLYVWYGITMNEDRPDLCLLFYINLLP